MTEWRNYVNHRIPFYLVMFVPGFSPLAFMKPWTILLSRHSIYFNEQPVKLWTENFSLKIEPGRSSLPPSSPLRLLASQSKPRFQSCRCLSMITMEMMVVVTVGDWWSRWRCWSCSRWQWLQCSWWWGRHLWGRSRHWWDPPATTKSQGSIQILFGSLITQDHLEQWSVLHLCQDQLSTVVWASEEGIISMTMIVLTWIMIIMTTVIISWF